MLLFETSFSRQNCYCFNSDFNVTAEDKVTFNDTIPSNLVLGCHIYAFGSHFYSKLHTVH